MIKQLFFTAGFFAALLSSCISPEKLIQNTEAERLYFGNYGGFTNVSVDYVIISHSHIYKIEKDSLIFVTRLSKKQSSALKEQITASNLEQTTLNEPGNMTYYLRLIKPNFKKELKWSGNSQNIQIKELYKTLMSSINQ